MTVGAREGSGRKRVNIDLDQVEKLCGLQCTAHLYNNKIEYLYEAPAPIHRGKAKG